MLKRSSKDLVASANSEIETITAADAVKLAGDPNVLFVDVREPAEREKGRIKGSVHAPRGLLEFHADPASPLHIAEIASGRKLVLYCASGGRSALGAKTLKEMGYEGVANLLGGFPAWKEAGGPTEG